MCRGCACTDLRACPGGCSWVLLDIDYPTGICSACAEDMEWDMATLANACCEVTAAELERAAQRALLREA
jgi:predicted amidophosphoribosyltransferase